MNQKLLKQLRNETGASFLLCRDALNHTNDTYEDALTYINDHQKKEQGNLRVASKGVVEVVIKDNDAILFEVNAETDFINKNPYFIDFIESIKIPLIESKVTNAKAALDICINGKTIKELLEHTAAVTKEAIQLRRFYRVRKADTQTFGTYSHLKNKIASLVIINGVNQEVASQLSMQVVAQNAQYLSVETIDKDTINYERFMFEKQHKTFSEIEFTNYLKSISLLDQIFIKDPNMTVDTYINQKNISVVDFYKFELGQGIDNKLNCRLDIPCDGSKITFMPK
jgi:elongation factor Ts